MAVEMIGGRRLCEPLLATTRIATRHDKLARNYVSALRLVAVAFWL